MTIVTWDKSSTPVLWWRWLMTLHSYPTQYAVSTVFHFLSISLREKILQLNTDYNVTQSSNVNLRRFWDEVFPLLHLVLLLFKAVLGKNWQVRCYTLYIDLILLKVCQQKIITIWREIKKSRNPKRPWRCLWPRKQTIQHFQRGKIFFFIKVNM